MLNRRHLRIKGLQTIYSYQQAEVRELAAFEKNLLSNIQTVHRFYFLLLLLSNELAYFEEADSKERSSKFLPTKDDLQAKPYLLHNRFIKLLSGSKEFNDTVKKYKLSWEGEEVLMREILNSLKSREEYKAYCAKEERTLKEDVDLILFIYKQVIFRFPLLEQYLEEKNMNWPVDEESVESMVLKTVKAYKTEDMKEPDLLPITANWDDDHQFIVELFRKTILNDEEYSKLIADKTQNWDVERIALIDTILMKMAIAEIIHFNSIPIKVTMNEYIDISKEFSTPKSKVFINGILDKIVADLKADNRISKTGRGLIE